jgi:hypothetical protein
VRVAKPRIPRAIAFAVNAARRSIPIADLVTQQVSRILAEQFKERGLVEYEVSDHIIAHFGSYLKIAAWVFAPGLAACLISIAIAAFFGFKTYTDASHAIHTAADTAVSEVQGKANKAGQAIAEAGQKAQSSFREYDEKAPKLRGQLDAAERQLKSAQSRISQVMQSATENQQKLSAIKDTRATNPDITLGQLSPSIVTPSSLGTFSASLAETYRLGDSGERVKQIQTRLKDRNCYQGEATGVFDQATSDAVIAFKKAKDALSPILLFGRGTYDGTIDYMTSLDLSLLGPGMPELSGLGVRCPG